MPLILPLANQPGVNLVHLGAMVVVNIGIGIVTLPFATSILVGSKISGIPYGDLVPPMMRFLVFVSLPVLFLTTYIPALSRWLCPSIGQN